MDKAIKREFALYILITIILILVSFLNNKFWKLGKKQDSNTNIQNTTYLESGNIIYDVPYEEQWLD